MPSWAARVSWPRAVPERPVVAPVSADRLGDGTMMLLIESLAASFVGAISMGLGLSSRAWLGQWW